MKLFIILGLAVAARATTSLDSPQIIRIGSVGVAVADVQGSLVLKSDASAPIPVFELKSSKMEHETEFYTFRCRVITELPVSLTLPYVPYQPSSSKPVLICRNSGFNKGSMDSADKKAFLFTHNGLKLAPHVKEVEIMVGKNTVANFLLTHGGVPPAYRKMRTMKDKYDGYKLVKGGTSPYHTLLGYNY